MAYSKAFLQLTENLPKNFKLIFKVNYNNKDYEILKCMFENDILVSFVINKYLPIDFDTINTLKYKSSTEFAYFSIEEVINEIFDLALTMKISDIDGYSLTVEFRDFEKDSIINKPLIINFDKEKGPKINLFEV